MNDRPKVYVMGPYTKGDPVLNVRRAIEMADELWRLGYAPFLPHINMLWHIVCPRPYSDWLEIDLAWLPVCAAAYRLTHGPSRGADKEEGVARDLGIPVFTCTEDLRAAVPPQTKEDSENG